MSIFRTLLIAWLMLSGLASLRSAIAEPKATDQAGWQRRHTPGTDAWFMAEIEARFAELPPGTPLRITGVVPKPVGHFLTMGLAGIYESARLKASAEVQSCGGQIALAGGPILSMYVNAAQLDCIRRKGILGRLQIDHIIPVPSLR